MNTSRLIKILAILAIATLVTGCKLAVMVPSGGDVTSSSGTRNCTGGSLCEHNITDSTFNDSFTAVAKPGYVFTKWNSGSGFFCGNSTNPTCTLSNVGTAGVAGFEAVIATGQFFYVMPLFEFVGIDTDGDGVKDHLDADDDNDGVLDVDDACPIAGPNLSGFGCPVPPLSETVTVNGKIWAQPDLFSGVTRDQIQLACPLGICSGLLNGHDMTGWVWASMDDVEELFSAFVPELLLRECGDYFGCQLPVADLSMSDGIVCQLASNNECEIFGFRTTTNPMPQALFRALAGWTASPFDTSCTSDYCSFMGVGISGDAFSMGWGDSWRDSPVSKTSGWFYRIL